MSSGQLCLAQVLYLCTVLRHIFRGRQVVVPDVRGKKKEKRSKSSLLDVPVVNET